jgi:hypothetical protein
LSHFEDTVESEENVDMVFHGVESQNGRLQVLEDGAR